VIASCKITSLRKDRILDVHVQPSKRREKWFWTVRLCVCRSWCSFFRKLSRAWGLTDRVETLGACSVVWGIASYHFLCRPSARLQDNPVNGFWLRGVKLWVNIIWSLWNYLGTLSYMLIWSPNCGTFQWRTDGFQLWSTGVFQSRSSLQLPVVRQKSFQNTFYFFTGNPVNRYWQTVICHWYTSEMVFIG